MKKIKIVPYILQGAISKNLTENNIIDSITKKSNEIKGRTSSGREIIGRIVSYEIDSTGGIPNRLFLRISSNYKNDRSKVQVDNTSVVKSGELKNNQTILNDMVITITFPKKGKILVSNSDKFGLLYLAYEGHPTYAINSLNYIIDEIFKDFNFGISSFLESNKYLDEIKGLISHYETNLVDVKEDSKDLIVGKTYIRPEYVKSIDTFDSIKSFSKGMFDEVVDLLEGVKEGASKTIKRKFFIQSLGKKIPLKEENGKILAVGFPQQINLSEYETQYSSIDNLFYKLFKPTIDKKVVLSNNLKMSFEPFLNEYETNLTSKK